MNQAIRTLVGNVAFFVGSVMFLPGLGKVPWGDTEWQTVGVWLFILGAFFMAIGSLGSLLVQVYEARERKRTERRREEDGHRERGRRDHRGRAARAR
jgi:hypothetical protein